MKPRVAAMVGFTLVEVLVALVVVAVAMGALVAAGSRVLATQSALEQRSLAFWVADNRLSELRLQPDLKPGQAAGQSLLAGRTWRWQQRIEPAPGGELLRIDVIVFDERDRPLVTQTGFTGR
ncbi:MAG: type II secretion system minor pseudopilin GspI [Wenzhouxiangellaceae bacterium]|nr:type II secretion system minor pseudopilin GspI [Wenzhouxiangellaceae bacterium]